MLRVFVFGFGFGFGGSAWLNSPETFQAHHEVATAVLVAALFCAYLAGRRVARASVSQAIAVAVGRAKAEAHADARAAAAVQVNIGDRHGRQRQLHAVDVESLDAGELEEQLAFEVDDHDLPPEIAQELYAEILELEK